MVQITLDLDFPPLVAVHSDGSEAPRVTNWPGEVWARPRAYLFDPIASFAEVLPFLLVGDRNVDGEYHARGVAVSKPDR